MMSNQKSSSNTRQPATGFERWLAGRGLGGNPFERWNAERDQDLPRYFVDVRNFDELLHQVEPSVVFAQRGCGKTAQRQMLTAHCRPLDQSSQRLAIAYTYDGFERALHAANGDIGQLHSLHHVSALLHLGLIALSEAISGDSWIQGAPAGSNAAPRWTAYVMRFAPHLTHGPTTGSPMALEGLSSRELMEGFGNLVKAAGLESCVVLLDGLDEFPLTAEDPARAVAFLAPLLGTLSLIECLGWAFKFFLPQELEIALRARRWFRADRLHIFNIEWSQAKLLDLIRQRLTHFSHREPPYENLAQLCEDELAQIINQELGTQANWQPRATLILADRLLRRHCQQPKPPDLIALKTWKQAKEEWQTRRADFLMEPRSQDMQLPEADEIVSSTISDGSDYPVLRIEEGKGLVWLGEREIRSEIKPKDYSVMLCLYRHESDVCSKDLIAAEAWPEEKSKEGISDQAIAASIARLRRVLRRFVPNRSYIETFRGKTRTEGGYRLYPEGFEEKRRSVK